MPSRLPRYDEYGHVHFLTISCYRRLQFFRHDPIKRVFVDGMAQTRAKLGIRWVGYVVMPEHVHLLLFPLPVGADAPVGVSTVLHDLKQTVGRHGNDAPRSIWREAQSLEHPPMDAWALGSGVIYKTVLEDTRLRFQRDHRENAARQAGLPTQESDHARSRPAG